MDLLFNVNDPVEISGLKEIVNLKELLLLIINKLISVYVKGTMEVLKFDVYSTN